MILADALKTYRFQLIICLIFITGLYCTIVPAMAVQWYSDENYSHGFIVPFISGYFLYTKRRELLEASVEPWGPGLLLIFLALVQLIFGWLGTEYFTMRSSLVVLIAGMIFYLLGIGILKIVILPLAYLLFMIPLPYIIYDSVAFPLKLFVTKISVSFLKVIGVVVLREGNIIMFPATTLEVADACSGMRSLISLLALGVAYAFISQNSVTKRWVIVLSTIPIAILTNTTRVIITGILAQRWGAKAAEGFFHEFAGLAMFVLAMALLVLVGTVMTKLSGNSSKH
jgi:exosortase